MADEIHPDLRDRLDRIRAALGPDASDADAVEYAVDWLSDHLGGGRVMLSDATVRRLTELLPAVSQWAADEGEPRTGLGDVLEIAVAAFHAQIFARAAEMIEDGDVKSVAVLH